jgi:hypothetical protein
MVSILCLAIKKTKKKPNMNTYERFYTEIIADITKWNYIVIRGKNNMSAHIILLCQSYASTIDQ